jgi:hypothetical protein
VSEAPAINPTVAVCLRKSRRLRFVAFMATPPHKCLLIAIGGYCMITMWISAMSAAAAVSEVTVLPD